LARGWGHEGANAPLHPFATGLQVNSSKRLNLSQTKYSFHYKVLKNILLLQIYRAFHRFGQAKFADGGSILGSSQFTSLLPLKIMPVLNVVKNDSK
jgi:hypothetical protein